MKKIIIFLFFLFIFIPNTKATTFYLGDKVNDMYIEAIGDSKTHNGAPFLLHRSDGKIVYCLNPFYLMNTTQNYRSYSYNDPIFNLTNEQLNRMNIISYYGYGYQGHTDKKWYGITQFLIWKTLNFKDIYFTDSFRGSRVEKYVAEVNELENMVNNYYLLPSFSNRSYEYNPNTNYEIVDTNNILNNYDIYESNIDAYISNNKLYINTNKSGNYVIKFKRKNPVSNNYLLYNLEGAQSLLYPGKIDDITFSISIEVNSGSITINKKDSENKKRLEASLENAVYGIYKDDKLIQKLSTDQNGTVHISDLTLGTYEVKEIQSSKGYNIDPNTYTVTLTKTNRNISIDFISNVIYGYLTINKYCGEENDYKIDKSAVFEVYNKDSLVATLTSLDSNYKLEYASYTIKQINGRKYYNLANAFDVFILKNEKYLYDIYSDKTDEIKAYEDLLDKREEQLNKKEEQLKEKEQELEKLKNEINNKYYELDDKNDKLNKKEQELKSEEEKIEKLKKEIDEIEKIIENKQNEIEKDKENNEKLTEELNILKEELLQKDEEVKEKEKNVNKLKQEIDNEYKRLQQLEIELLEKENNLKTLENNLKNKELNNNTTPLVVEVPNTYKKDNKNYFSIILIFHGSILILLNLVFNKKRKLHV